VLIRFLICSLPDSILLVSCSSERELPPVAAPADRQSQQSATQQQLRQQQQTDLSAAGQEQPVLEQQQREREESQSLSDEPQVQPESRPLSSGGPPEPEFDVEIAVGYLNHLAGELGPRASGTEQERAAAEYMAEVFRGLGYEVEIQQFTYTAEAEVARIDLADGSSNFAFRFSGSSNEPTEGELVDVAGVGNVDDFALADVAGRIAIVDRGVIEFRVKAAHAEAAGAIALIVTNPTLNESIGGSLGDDTVSIPILHVGKEAGDEIRARLGEIASIPASSPSAGESQNVVARKPAGACRVVVGGHYDTVPEVDGANDNASGTALTLALAAIWADHPSSSDICFIGFGAEELGLHGSRHYVGQLRLEDRLSEVTAMVNLDAIGDGRPPYRILASVEISEISNAVAADLQITAGPGSLPLNLGSDHASFSRVGIPVVFVFPPGAILHTPLDNLDNVDLELFEDISRLNHGILACLLQRAGSPISPSISCGEEEPQSSSRATLEE